MILFQWWPTWGLSEQKLLLELGFKRLDMSPFIEATSGEIWFHRQLKR